MSTSEQRPNDELIEHDRLAEEADLLTTLEANARVRQVLRDTKREIADLTTKGADDLELARHQEKLAQIEAALARYPGG